MDQAIVTIARFTEPLEADMARLRLQSAGIEVFLAGENARILEPGLGDLRLQVAAADEADARAVLADAGPSFLGDLRLQVAAADEADARAVLADAGPSAAALETQAL